MKLDASERAAMINLLTGLVGNHESMSTLRRVRGMVGFDTEEIKAIEQNGNSFYGIDLPKEVMLDEWTIDYITTGLQKLDESNQMPESLFTLYEKFVQAAEKPLPEQDRHTKEMLKAQRKGKKTVAIVGMAPSTCNFTPWDDESVEIWGANEMHVWKWMKRANRWFQIHNTFKQPVAKRGVRGHYEWLKENPWKIPIYMQLSWKDIPKSRVYPVYDICDKFLAHIRRGENRIKYFNSSFDYMMAVALHEDFERFEVYGFDMMGDNEYEKQLPSASFWLGIASQHADVYLPEECMMLKSDLYGGRDQGEGWV